MIDAPMASTISQCRVTICRDRSIDAVTAEPCETGGREKKKYEVLVASMNFLSIFFFSIARLQRMCLVTPEICSDQAKPNRTERSIRHRSGRFVDYVTKRYQRPPAANGYDGTLARVIGIGSIGSGQANGRMWSERRSRKVGHNSVIRVVSMIAHAAGEREILNLHSAAKIGS